MVMRIHMDCSGCYRKVRRALLNMHGKSVFSLSLTLSLLNVQSYLFIYFCMIVELETHLIEKTQCRVSVCGKFIPQDVAIKLRKKTNRRVEILDIQHYIDQRPFITTSTDPMSNQYPIGTCIT